MTPSLFARLAVVPVALTGIMFAATPGSTTEQAHAGEPPPPPMRIAGQVRLAIGPIEFHAPRNATVEALIDGNICGETTTVVGGNYLLGVLPDPPFPGCGTDGDVVAFRVTILGRSRMAEEAVAFVTGGGAQLDLRVRLWPP